MELPNLNLALSSSAADSSSASYAGLGATTFGNSGFIYQPAAQSNVPLIVGGLIALAVLVIVIKGA